MNHRTAAENTNQQVGDHKQHQDDKQEGAKVAAFEPLAKVLDLGRVTVTASDRPDLDANKEKAERVDNPAGRGHQGINTDTPLKGLAGGSHQRKGRHGRPEEGEKKQDRAERVAGQHVVRGGPTEETVGRQSEHQE